MAFDTLIKHGMVIDGSGCPSYRADVGVRQGTIVAVGTDLASEAATVLDASGLAVAPGFIDSHSHADWLLPLASHADILAPMLLQGVTTVVTGQCGFSPAPVSEDSIPLVNDSSEMMREGPIPYGWRTMQDFLDSLQTQGLLLNAAFLVGHGTLRYLAMGDRIGPPTESEMMAMQTATRQALREGAYGLSAGLAYAPGVFAQNPELEALLTVVRDEGALWTVHGRAYSWVSPFYKPMLIGRAHNLRSVEELIGIARRSGVRLQLSHQIFVGRHTWRTHQDVLRAIDGAREEGVDVAFDAFPYTVGNTTIKVVFPAWFLADFSNAVNDRQALRKLKGEIDLLRLALGLSYPDIRLLWADSPELGQYEGLDFGAIARQMRMAPFETYMHVARETQGRARVLLDTYSGDAHSEAPLQAALSHQACAFMTDTILTRRGHHNPASFGTFPRILGRYSRDLGLFTREEAVRRMTAFPAERIGLQGIGRIEKGYQADLVLFDPTTVADTTTPDHPDSPPLGIRKVLIAGQIVAENGRLTGIPHQGRVLRRS